VFVPKIAPAIDCPATDPEQLRQFIDTPARGTLRKPDRLIEVTEGCTPYGFPRPMEYSTMYHELLRDASFWAFPFCH
jgi:hypothetical protein